MTLAVWKVLVGNFIWFWRQAKRSQKFQIQVALWTLPTGTTPFSWLKTAFNEHRYLFWVSSTCENVREYYEEKNSSSYRLIQGQFGWPIRVITNYILDVAILSSLNFKFKSVIFGHGYNLSSNLENFSARYSADRVTEFRGELKVQTPLHSFRRFRPTILKIILF